MIGERNSSLPLPLLIIIGKSRGEGDYYNYENKKLVGTWCDSISFVDSGFLEVPICEMQIAY